MQLKPCSAKDAMAAVSANEAWLEECVIHLLCVLALDRFGDYVSDQVSRLPYLTTTVYSPLKAFEPPCSVPSYHSYL
jgi:hypothetical protein